MRTPRFLLLLVLALTAVVVAGCGGDDDGDTTATAAVAASSEAAGGADSAAAEATAADTGGLDTARATDATGTGAAADVSPEKAAFIEQADAICATPRPRSTRSARRPRRGAAGLPGEGRRIQTSRSMS